ncbi:MAG: hypothetical protein WD738_00855 [Pirellulales bacterium]
MTEDGWIIGSFTEQIASTLASGGGSKVHFFRIRARPAAIGSKGAVKKSCLQK